MDVLGPDGRLVATLNRLPPDEAEIITKVKRRPPSSEPRVPSARVQAMLRKLDEMDSRGELTADKVEQLVRQVIDGMEP